MERIKAARNEQQSDRVENRFQHRCYLGRFDVEKVRFVIENASCRFSKLLLLLQRGAQFQKNHETKWFESEKWSRKALDGKCDGYMWGLGGAKKRKC